MKSEIIWMRPLLFISLIGFSVMECSLFDSNSGLDGRASTLGENSEEYQNRMDLEALDYLLNGSSSHLYLPRRNNFLNSLSDSKKSYLRAGLYSTPDMCFFQKLFEFSLKKVSNLSILREPGISSYVYYKVQL